MTPLFKPVRRVVRSRDGGFLVATLAPEGLLIRAKGQRTEYPAIPYGQLYLIAARLYNTEQDAEKRRAKAVRRAAR